MARLLERLKDVQGQLTRGFAAVRENIAKEQRRVELNADLREFRIRLGLTRSHAVFADSNGYEAYSPISDNFFSARKMIPHLAACPERDDLKNALITAHTYFKNAQGQTEHDAVLRLQFNLLEELELTQNKLANDPHLAAGVQALQEIKPALLKVLEESLTAELERDLSGVNGISVSAMGISTQSSVHTWIRNCALYPSKDPAINGAVKSVFVELINSGRMGEPAQDASQKFVRELQEKIDQAIFKPQQVILREPRQI